MRTGNALLVVVLVLMICLAASAHAASLLSSSSPGAFGVRYLQDRAVMTYTVQPPEGQPEDGSFQLRVYLPQAIKWIRLDRKRVALKTCKWSGSDQQLALTVPFGSHRLHLGWAGDGQLPPETATIPVTLDGKTIGRLRARFTLMGMEAKGQLDTAAGRAGLRLRLAGDLSPDELSVICGGTKLTRWRGTRDTLVAREDVLLPDTAVISLTVNHYGLVRSPVTEIALDDFRGPTLASVVEDTIPDGALLVEAEDYSAAGGSPVVVDPGSHFDTHGGSCVYTFKGDGAWLEWIFDVPRAGSYDLFARISSADEFSYRLVTVDGESPDGLGLVRFPGTGGWGHAKGEWQTLQIAGVRDGAPALQLDAGAHHIRFTGALGPHLNVDYLFLTPSP